jgi:hypothetical protein
MMMHVPEGYSEQQVFDDIMAAVDSLVSNFSFGYMDDDDLRQEGFLFACEALPRFDPHHEKGASLQGFLRTHVRNRFINLRRNKLHRNSPPCSICPFQNKKKASGCAEFTDKNECPKWAGWYARNQAKRSLVESCDVSKVTHVTPTSDGDICSRLSCAELLQFVSDKIPLALRADYRRFLEGARLSKPRREAVVEAVREIVGVQDGNEVEAWSD